MNTTKEDVKKEALKTIKAVLNSAKISIDCKLELIRQLLITALDEGEE